MNNTVPDNARAEAERRYNGPMPPEVIDRLEYGSTTNAAIVRTEDSIAFFRAEIIAMRRSAKKLRNQGTIAPIIDTDIDVDAIRVARKNAETAGVHRMIRFEVCDFAETPLTPEKGIVVINPEYGERLGAIAELEKTYSRMGDFFKQRCPGWTGYIFTGNLELSKKVGLRVSRRIEFFNARIDCRLLKYEL